MLAKRYRLVHPDHQESDLSSSLMTRGGDEPEPADRRAAGPGSCAGRLSLETRRVYDGAWQAFIAWYASQDGPAVLPVPPERVVAFIESLPPSLGPNGVKLRLAAIAQHHRDRGSPSPTAHAAVRAVLRRRQMNGEAVLARLDSCGEDLAGLRNRALLLLVQAGGLAPADVAGLDREDVRFVDGELVLSVQAADPSAGQPGQAVRLARQRGDPLCPVHALERWLQRSGLSYGAVFRAVTVHGTLERRLGVVGLRCILRQIEVRAAAQAMPPGRRPVHGAWRKPVKGTGPTKARGSGASVPEPPARTPRRMR